ncbi:MAG TPA: ATP-binding cassette domain-containing protein [Casimicrobiaceae bacterium]|nr:ATP-binding cassette domain-containing protein [Casimicrobiaceae bacterium]
MSVPLLHVDAVTKRYARGVFRRRTTFVLEADFVVEAPAVVGVMGPNGSGKTTLFELMTGSNLPTSGRVRIAGQDIHRVRYGERDRLAIHYHQSYQVRAFKRTRPSFMLERARSASPHVHLFDEPQFSAQDGYIGFMLDFFRRLRERGRLVFLCLHPNEPYHVDILREACERFIFVERGKLVHAADFASLVRLPPVVQYLGRLAPAS